MKTIKELKSKITETKEIAKENGWITGVNIMECLDEYSYRRYVQTQGKLEQLGDIIKLINKINNKIEKELILSPLMELKVRIKG